MIGTGRAVVVRRRVVALAASLSTALIGQGASFVAVLVPILGHRIEAVALLVTVSATGNIATALGSWSFASVYPAIRGRSAARAAIPAAAIMTALLAALLLVAALALAGAVPAVAAVLALSSLFTVCQTCYFISLGFSVRQGSARGIGRLRLVYGVTNLALALVSVLPVVPDEGLALGTSLAFLVAALATPLTRPRVARILLATLTRTSAAAVAGHLAAHWRAALAGLFTNVGLQASALIVLGLPGFRGVWAVVLRIGNGFGTIGVSVLGPRVQSEIGRAVRRDDRAAAIAANRAGLLSGVVLAVLSFAVIAAVLLHTAVLAPLDPAEVVVVLVAIVAFVGTSTVVSPLSANLVVLGRQRVNLALNAVRVVVLVPAVLLPSPIAVLLVLVLAEGAVQLLYAGACIRASARIGLVRIGRGTDQSRTAIGSSGVR